MTSWVSFLLCQQMLLLFSIANHSKQRSALATNSWAKQWTIQQAAVHQAYEQLYQAAGLPLMLPAPALWLMPRCLEPCQGSFPALV
jgi:hypothetical protein